MKPIIFIGSGSVASEVISYLENIQNVNSDFKYTVHGYLDDSIINFNQNVFKYGYTEEFLGLIDNFDFPSDYSYVFGFASPTAKSKIYTKIKHFNLDFPNIIHPSSIIDRSAKLGQGNIINPYCVIGPNSHIGDFNLLTSYSFISHDCKIGNYNFFSTAGLSGDVFVGNSNFFGIRSTVIPSITIGNENTIQAGMTVDKNVGHNETVFYRFREKVLVINNKF
jgi:sugar O-acyltransferase (sialic acid O-acetyltransferase NeuD family)